MYRRKYCGLIVIVLIPVLPGSGRDLHSSSFTFVWGFRKMMH